MLYTFLKLLLAHILGDFVFHPRKWADGRKHHIRFIFYHVVVHAVLVCLFFINDLANWWPDLTMIVLSHLAIDSLKVSLERKIRTRPLTLFAIDQCLHIAVLATIVGCYYDIYIDVEQLLSIENLIVLIAFLLTVFVSPIVLRVFFSKWARSREMEARRQETLVDAGLVIGILERMLIVVFINLNFLEGIGFLLAAKSIFRFGDLANSKDKQFTEYVLVGTFASFVMAIAIGLALKWMLASI